MTRPRLSSLVLALAALVAPEACAQQAVQDLINIPKVLQNMKVDGAMMQKTKEVKRLNDLMKQTLGAPGAAGPQNLSFLYEAGQLQDARVFFPNVTLPDDSKAGDPKSLFEGRNTVNKLYFAPKTSGQMTPALHQAYEIARSDSQRRAALDAYALAIANRDASTKANDQMLALAEKAAAAPNTRGDIQANHAATIASVYALGRTQAAIAALLHIAAAETLRRTPITKNSRPSTASATGQ